MIVRGHSTFSAWGTVELTVSFCVWREDLECGSLLPLVRAEACFGGAGLAPRPIHTTGASSPLHKRQQVAALVRLKAHMVRRVQVPLRHTLPAGN
jgi:hypothetical protein